MSRRLGLLILLLLLLSSCTTTRYSFQVNNDLIYLEQSTENFDISMLNNSVLLFYGDEERPLHENVSVIGNVDLSKVGNYEITLSASYKNNVSEVELDVLVVDTKAPKFYIFEDELLVLSDEDLEINSSSFFINLVDGINGQINERIKIEGEYDLNTIKTYPITLIGTDDSGNDSSHEIKLRVTDLIDEKALYLYKKANLATSGGTFVFEDDNKANKILNFQDALAIFTPRYLNHFYWLSGLTGTYNPNESGVHLSFVDNDAYADFSQANKVVGYKQTTLSLQNKTDTRRHYIAKSTYKVDNKEEVRLSKFIIEKIDGIWLVEEFYKPN